MFFLEIGANLRGPTSNLLIENTSSAGDISTGDTSAEDTPAEKQHKQSTETHVSRNKI